VAGHGEVFNPKENVMAKAAGLKVVADNKTNDARESISASEPYVVTVTIKGAADFLFHRWSCEAVDAKSKAAKNSVAKKTDNVESYVYRDAAGMLCIPGEYLRQSIIHAAKFKVDPRSPRKSGMDLYKAGVTTLTQLASVGKEKWDYLDTRRVVVQRSGVSRTRPALSTGWAATFELMVLLPEYIGREDLNDTLAMAGRLIGVGDFRPTYGRFQVVRFE
jgi:hypothetical protein